MATDLYIGKRLSYDNQLCTVRYQGQVQGTKGEWLGVEWDDPIRGKHTGEHGGIKYFECLRKDSTAGSFIRPSRKPDTPRSFAEALKAKYASDPVQDPSIHIVFTNNPNDQAFKKDPLVRINQPIRISGKEVEEVGFDKIRKQLAQLSELKIIILDGLLMERSLARLKGGSDAWPEGLTDVKDACPKATELDLSRNLFEEWREVASICEQLEKLRSLKVDGCRFRDTSVTDAERIRCLKAFANIKELSLEEDYLPWDDLARLTHLFPSLTHFFASSNLYTSLTTLTPTPTLTSLTLEDNALTTLSSLSCLTSLPHLRRLILKQNHISQLTSSPSDPLPTFSPSLSEIDLTFNAISTFSFIDRLPTAFPGLASLRISHNPLYTHLTAPDTGRPLSAEDGYMLTIARLPCLTSLNYSKISDKERLNAETYYLSLIARELGGVSEKDEAAVLGAHPRWGALCEEYGMPVIKRGEGTVNPNSLAARLVKLTVYVVNGGDGKGRREAGLEIPARCTAYTLLGMVGRHFGLRPMRCRLVWETGDWVPAPRGEVDEDGGFSDEGSEAASDDEDGGEKPAANSIMREVEILPGTRSVGTWIEGTEATIRLEVR